MKTKFKVIGISLPVSAEIVGESLSKIYHKNAHKLTAQSVVKEASSSKHPLHACFEWNDTKAAQKYRLEQARQIIKCTTVVTQQGKKKVAVRAFISIRKDEHGDLSHNPFAKGESYYASVKDAMSNKILEKYTIESVFRDLQNLMDKYETVKAVSKLFKKIKHEMSKYKKKSKETVRMKKYKKSLKKAA